MNKLFLKPFNNKILKSIIKRHCHSHSKTNFGKFTAPTNTNPQLDELNSKIDKLNKNILEMSNLIVYSYLFNFIIIPVSIFLKR